MVATDRLTDGTDTGQSGSLGASPVGPVVLPGYVRGSGGSKSPCARPVRYVSGGNPGVRRCRHCDGCLRYEQKLRFRAILDGLTSAPWAGRFVSHLVVTCPSGDEHKSFIPESAGYRPGMRRPQCQTCFTGLDVGDWNPLSGHFFSRLMDAIRYWYPDASYSRTPEIQEAKGRGALHFHVLLVTNEPVDPALLWRLARRSGFGCSVDVSTVSMGAESHAARYVSGYMVKGRTKKHLVPWNVLDAAGRSRPDYRHSCSRDWPVTIAQIMAARRAHAEEQSIRGAMAALAPLLAEGDSPPPAITRAGTPP